jgi:hypothetical protein
MKKTVITRRTRVPAAGAAAAGGGSAGEVNGEFAFCFCFRFWRGISLVGAVSLFVRAVSLFFLGGRYLSLLGA